MTTSLFNYGPLPNADMIAKVIEHTRAINTVHVDAVEFPTSKAGEPSKTVPASDGVDAHQSNDKTTKASVNSTANKGVLA